MKDLRKGDYVLVPSLQRGMVFTYRGPVIERRHPEIYVDDPNDPEGDMVVPSGEYDMSETEEIADESRAIVVMVGDDHRYTVDLEDVEFYSEDDHGDVCSCGQLHCGWGGS